MALLRVQELDVFYDQLQALFRISLEVNEGEVVALLGANGAGKSTTLRAISGLLAAPSGSIEFDGQPLKRLGSHAIVERGLVHVPEGRRVFPLLTVVENLTLGSYSPSARPRRSKSMEYVYSMFPRLAERRTQLAGTMSGGEQQMLAIGRGLMSCPRLLMLDEPTLGLSPRLADEMFRVVQRLNQDGMTILIVEQNVQKSLEAAHRAYVIENGHNVLEGPGRELLSNPQVREAYLGI